MNIINEYKILSKKHKHLLSKYRSTCENKYKIELDTIEQHLSILKNNPNIVEYISIKERKVRLQKIIGVNKFYKKDTSKLESQLNDCEARLCELENQEASLEQDNIKFYNITTEKSTCLGESNADVYKKSHNNKNCNKESDLNYYNINLAWERADNKILNIIKSYLDETTYININKSDNMVTWRYNYTTPEEKTYVKTLQICAYHLAKILKEYLDLDDNVEVFGKMQNY